MKLSEMNPREFAQHLKQKYKFFEVYSGLKYIGRGEYIHGYYVIVAGYDNPQDYRRRIEDIADTANGGAILYVK